MLLLAVSCGLEKVAEYPRTNPDGIWTGPSYGKYTGGECLAAVVEYQYGWDWHESASAEGLKHHLTLCQDGIPVLRVPVADSCFISADPQRHRIRNGHLYTDMTDGRQTVLKRDGMLVYRCEGAEEVIDVRETGNQVHTVSEKEGGGFVYRIDGVPYVERDSGRLFGTFEETEDSLCFFFSQTISVAEGREEVFYMVADAKVRKIESPEDVVHMWDMGLFDGEVCMLASVSEDSNPVFIRGEKRESLYDFYGNKIIICSFLASEDVCVYTRLLHPGHNMMTDLLWFEGGRWKMYSIGSTLSAACMREGQYCSAVNHSGSSQGYIYKGGTGYYIPDDYAISVFDCMTLKDSVLYAGLSPLKGNNPILWKDGVLDTLDINGYITCLQ